MKSKRELKQAVLKWWTRRKSVYGLDEDQVKEIASQPMKKVSKGFFLIVDGGMAHGECYELYEVKKNKVNPFACTVNSFHEAFKGKFSASQKIIVKKFFKTKEGRTLLEEIKEYLKEGSNPEQNKKIEKSLKKFDL